MEKLVDKIETMSEKRAQKKAIKLAKRAEWDQMHPKVASMRDGAVKVGKKIGVTAMAVGGTIFVTTVSALCVEGIKGAISSTFGKHDEPELDFEPIEAEVTDTIEPETTSDTTEV